mmetsp:Transcript_88154/g.227322  ORF Transcript_88154/g.227322 Transcript_88154/m.227322 type:complete len:264 (+) Transcript_88154:111-902(+)
MSDNGTCCFFVPLRAGVACIAMLVWINSLVCILALITGDIRLQATGYNTQWYRVPSVVGSFGLVVGFFGIIGAYEDKLKWVHSLNRFLVVKIIADIGTRLADFHTLRQCDSYIGSTSMWSEKSYGHAGINYVNSNPQLEALANAHICPQARWAYVLGAFIDIFLWIYFLHRCYTYETHLAQPTRYAIDFGVENARGEDRWRLYQVKAASAKRRPPPKDDEQQRPGPPAQKMQDYGSIQGSAAASGAAAAQSQQPYDPASMGHP